MQSTKLFQSTRTFFSYEQPVSDHSKEFQRDWCQWNMAILKCGIYSVWDTLLLISWFTFLLITVMRHDPSYFQLLITDRLVEKLGCRRFQYNLEIYWFSQRLQAAQNICNRVVRDHSTSTAMLHDSQSNAASCVCLYQDNYHEELIWFVFNGHDL